MRLSTILRRALAASAALLALAAPVRAQPFAAPAQGDTALRIILLTMGPGDEVWERFGHNAIWVHDPANGADVAYNYGMFDFRQENFILNFARGRMNYWMEGFDAYLTLDHYRMLNRSVWAQELNLTAAQARQVKEILEENARPENRFYRYDYYRDNCSTRVRDVLDRVLGGALKRATATQPAGVTYRWHTRRLVGDGAANVPIYTAINTGLGPAADRPLTKWEEMFLPMKLRDEVHALRVPDAQGRMVPLVAREQTIFAATRPPEPSGPPHWLLGYLLAGLAIGGLIAFLATRAPRSTAARLAFSAVSGTWLLVAGIGGLVLLGLWVATDHAIAYRNLNLFQLSPFALPLAVFVPALAQGKRWAPRWAVRLSLVVAAMSVLGLLLKVLPPFRQVNGEVIALALPINLAVAWAAWRLAGAPRVIAPAGKSRNAEREPVAA
ncbi:DUF4105 domain-containing protein [Longimicrobium sp.]|uniref:Lnb N-terminal periplasmic domain-containing protein n=1 Tax=Longimicrobium sp. TaxID=2029185 RepID=UPI002C2E6F57|nr:DUF4105 domain-containing protein [Longimicrobium sp.]HSU14596.1 DUF4105 domain-containing protein [Longimicrobium sp.]